MNWRQSLVERDRLSLGAIAIDSSFTIVDASNGLLDFAGYERTEVVGRSAVDLVHPDDLVRAADVLDELAVTPGERADGMYRLQLRGGAYRQFRIRAHNFGPTQDDIVVLEFAEPSDQLRAEAFADDAVDVMRMLSENFTLNDSFEWVVRVAERHVNNLQLVITLFGASPGEPNQVTSRQPVPQALADANMAATPQALPAHVQVAVREFSHGPWSSSRKIASLDNDVPGRLTSLLTNTNGDIAGYVEALRSTPEPPTDSEWLVHSMISRMMIAALHRYEFDQQLRHAADHDSLTGLVNRRRLLELMEKRKGLESCWLAVLDLDNFSWINNTLGHQAGDQALVAVANGLRSACPDNAVVARLGGDEFVLWGTEPLTPSELSSLGAAIGSSLVLKNDQADRRSLVRCSIGIVTAQADESATALISRADKAMYVSKHSGGDSATVR